MSFFKKNHSKTPNQSGRPWIEFPNSQDNRPIDTLERICAQCWVIKDKPKLIEIEGQGVGSRPDSYDIRCLFLYRRVVFTDEPIGTTFDITLRESGFATVIILGDRHGLDLTNESPASAAGVLNELFLRHLLLKPYTGRDHYNIAAY